MTEEVRLYITYPSNRDLKGRFSTSFAGLTHYLTTPGIGNNLDYKLTHFTYHTQGYASSLPITRQRLLDLVLDSGFTHWLSLDDDMTFPMDIVDRLISHGKDIVSCNARRKTNSIEEKQGSCQALDGHPINSSGKSGLEELNTMGGAIFLAKIDSFRHIKKPHFQVVWSDSHNDYVGEDVYFSGLLKANGVRLWCDHDASQTIGHIGEYEYRW